MKKVEKVEKNEKFENPRAAAVRVLLKIKNEGAYVNIALKEELLKNRFKEVDKRLVTAIVYGCVRYELRIDYVISKFSSVKIKKLSDKVLAILRIAIYQMMFLTKIPKSAAVNESVKLCLKLAYKSKGFVNAVLRRTAEEIDNITYPDIATKYSYPKELCDYFLESFDNGEKIMESLNGEGSFTIRANTNKISEDELLAELEKRGIASKKTEISEVLKISGISVSELDLYKEGYFSVSGMASVLAVYCMGLCGGETVLDVCAAPGGKSVVIAQKVGKLGVVHSFDIHEHKSELILKNAERMGLKNIFAHSADMSEVQSEYISLADAVLADVPCSGLGIISKKPDIKYAYSREGQKELAILQGKILKASSAYVKKGGVLLYSTCSMGDLENIDNINKFLRENKDFCLESIESFLPERFKNSTGESGYLNICPDGEFDGFFICKMRRKNS